jgi:Fibronectin type III domain
MRSGPLLTSRALTAASRLAVLAVAALAALALVGTASAAPGRPQGLRVVDTTRSSITISWRKPAGAVRYRIYKRGNYLRTITNRRAIVSGIYCHRRYGIDVRAVDASGEVGPAATRSVRKGTGCVPRARIERRNRGWSCRRPLARIAARHGGRLPLLVKINFTRYVHIDPGVIEIRGGCRGDANPNTIDLILKVGGNGRTRGGTVDAIKIRENPHDIQITGYANCGPRGRNEHQDGAAIQGGRNIEFIDFMWGNWKRRRATCHGAAGTFIPGVVNNWPVRGMSCIRCKSVSCNHGMFIDESTGTLVEDSRWRSGNPADRSGMLPTGERGMCDHGSDPCVINRAVARNYTIRGNRCDKWPYGS